MVPGMRFELIHPKGTAPSRQRVCQFRHPGTDFGGFGRGDRDRTRDLRCWRPSLYQLSYSPTTNRNHRCDPVDSRGQTSRGQVSVVGIPLWPNYRSRFSSVWWNHRIGRRRLIAEPVLRRTLLGLSRCTASGSPGFVLVHLMNFRRGEAGGPKLR